MIDVAESRISKPDPDGKYVTRNEGGAIIAMEAAYVSTINLSEYKLGAGLIKYRSTGGPGIYINVVLIGFKKEWMLN